MTSDPTRGGFEHDKTACWCRIGRDAHEPHENRPPSGPCEDISQCGCCWAMRPALRPLGETFYDHDDDCQIPLHYGPCVGATSALSDKQAAWLAKRDQ